MDSIQNMFELPPDLIESKFQQEEEIKKKKIHTTGVSDNPVIQIKVIAGVSLINVLPELRVRNSKQTRMQLRHEITAGGE